MEEKKIQFEGISDEETWKLFSWFEKLINQTETKKVIRLLDFLNKKSNVSWNTIYDLSFFMQRKNDESSEQTETWNKQNENKICLRLYRNIINGKPILKRGDVYRNE